MHGEMFGMKIKEDAEYYYPCCTVNLCVKLFTENFEEDRTLTDKNFKWFGNEEGSVNLWMDLMIATSYILLRNSSKLTELILLCFSTKSTLKKLYIKAKSFLLCIAQLIILPDFLTLLFSVHQLQTIIIMFSPEVLVLTTSWSCLLVKDVLLSYIYSVMFGEWCKKRNSFRLVTYY